MNRGARTLRALCAVALLSSAAACLPTLRAESAPPPGRSARLDEIHGFWGIKGYRIELSQGVAMALTCHFGGPCEELTVTSDDPSIAEVRPAALGQLESAGLANQKPVAAVVVVGQAPGRTRLRLRSGDGDRDIAVTIVPLPGLAATDAR